MSQLYFSKDKINQSYLGKDEVKTPSFQELIPNYLSYEWDTSQGAESVIQVNDVRYSFSASPVEVTLEDLGITEITVCYNFFTNDPYLKYSYLTKVNQLPILDKVTNFGRMFRGCSGLTSLDVKNIVTSNAKSVSAVFSGCTNITELDLSGWDTSNVTYMSYLFAECHNLKSLNVSSFDTSNITDMRSIFQNCSALTSLDLSSWDASKVSDNYTKDLFLNCSSLTDFKYFKKITTSPNFRISSLGLTGVTNLDMTHLDISNLNDLSFFFNGCRNITSLDLSTWNTSNITNMAFMFADCSALEEVDLSGWDMTNVTSTAVMFNGCNALQRIYMRGCNENTINQINGVKPSQAVIITE